VAFHNSFSGERGTLLMVSTCHWFDQLIDTSADQAVEVKLNVFSAFLPVGAAAKCTKGSGRGGAADCVGGHRNFPWETASLVAGADARGVLGVA
jgi:hypothetical protein